MPEKKQGFFEKVKDWLKRVVKQGVERIDELFKQVEKEKNYTPKFQIENDFLGEKGVMRNAVGGKGLVKIPAKVTRIANAYSDNAYDEKFRNAVKKSEFITGLELPVGLCAIETKNIGKLKNLRNIYVSNLVDFCKCRLEGEVFNGSVYGSASCKNLYVNGEKIQNLVLPNGLEEINDWQFFGFYLKSVTVPSNVKRLGKNVFNANVEKFIFEGDSLELPTDFFNHFSDLKEVVILSDKLEFDPSVFIRCGDLEKITYPNNPSKTRVLINPEKDCKVKNGELVRYVGHARKVTVPNCVEKIGNGAFAGNEYLEEILIPDSVTEIGASCFEGCRNLKVVELSSALKSIEHATFLNCYGLEKIRIPDNVVKIGDNAFEGCKSLKEIAISAKVEEIGEETFCECEKLEKIVLPSVKEIGERAFIGCARLEKIVMEGEIEKIGKDAFFQLNTDLYFLGTVKKIGENNLSENRVHVRDISVWAKAEIFFEKFDELNCEVAYQFYKLSQWQLFCDEKEVKVVILPQGLKTIPVGNFYGCENIERVIVPDGVTSIGAFAFCGCRSLESVELPNSLQKIASCAFMGCRLKVVELPEKITVVREGTFANCNLEYVELPSGLTSIEAYAFIDNPLLRSVRIPEKLKSSGNYAIMAFDENCKCC